MFEVGVLLGALRRSKKLSQEGLGVRLGCGQAWISQIETGRRDPSLETLASWLHEVEAPPEVYVQILETVRQRPAVAA